MLTTTVTTVRASASRPRHFDERWARNQSAETPAAGHTRLRFVSSMTVRRPA
jgi:hypothetical protein